MFHLESSFLRFGAWSVLLHVGAVAMLGVLHVTRPMDNAKSRVTVTLLEPLAPVSQDAPPATPPMLHANRPKRPVAPQQVLPSPRRLRLPPHYPTIVTDIPQPPTHHATPPVTRKLLLDHHAADTLNLKNFMKTPARRTTPTTHTTAVPHDTQPIVTVTPPTHEWSFREVPTPARTAHANTQGAPKVLQDTTAGRKSPRTPARPLKQHDPHYPPVAKQRGWEGTVVLQLAISREGTVERATVRTSSGFSILDESAVQTVQTWKFEPARDGEFAIPSTVVQPIRFVLNQ